MEAAPGVTEWMAHDLDKFDGWVKVEHADVEEPGIVLGVWWDIECKYMDEYKHHVLETYEERLFLKEAKHSLPAKNSTPFGINSFL
ncbi:MAG: hypothetical protein ACK56F_21510 [bacterium]